MDFKDITGEDEKKDTSAHILQLVSFRLDKEEFAIDILIVQEIIRMIDITNVPNSPPFVEGVINLRGKVIPVIDLRKRFALPVKEFDKDTRIVVVDIKNNTIGFIVDSVSEIIRLPADIVEPSPPNTSDKVESEYINGIGKLDNRLLILLDLNKVLSLNEAEMLKGV